MKSFFFLFLLILIPVNAYGLCGISTSSNIDFGNWKVNKVTSEFSITVTNNGNSDANFSFSSEPWIDNNDNSIMARSETHYAYLQDRDYSNMQTLKANNDDGKIIEGNSNLIVYFKVLLNLLSGASDYIGDVSQKLTLRLEC